MTYQLRFETGSLAGMTVVTAATSIRLGREREHNDLILSNPEASRRHAILTVTNRGPSLEIIGQGPTALNDEAVVRSNNQAPTLPLSHGDRVNLGGVEFVYEHATARITVTSGHAAGRVLQLTSDAHVGTDPANHLVVPDAGIASLHLTIAATPWGFRAEPHYALIVNGSTSEGRVLVDGDELRIANTTLRFTVEVQPTAVDQDAEYTHSSLSVRNAVGELVVIAGRAKDQRVALGEDQVIIGSGADCTLVLHDPSVAPTHCVVSRNQGNFILTDVGSVPGTRLNDHRITQGTVLRPGDLITLGTTVLEARVLGGISDATRRSTKFTAFDLPAAPQPRFVVDGRVVARSSLTIGRAPSNDLVLDAPQVSRVHCTLLWQGGNFTIADNSTHGTYLDDRRVVHQPLGDGQVVRIADTLLRVSVRGEVCTLETTDALQARAALDVARTHAAHLTSVFARQEVAAALANPAMPPGAAGAGGVQFKTIMHVAPGQVEAEIAARKKDLRKGAPAWRQSSDLARDRLRALAIQMSALIALIVGTTAVFAGRGQAMLNHPLSAAHASQAFATRAKGLGQTLCAACHTAGDLAPAAKCQQCHAERHTPVSHAQLSCGACHREHRGEGPAPLTGTSTNDARAISGRVTCAQCHPNQHRMAFLKPGAQADTVRAGPLTTPVDLVALHATHSELRVQDQLIGVRCTTCHRGSGTPRDAAATPMAVDAAGLACFQCHQGAQEALQTGCDRCHGAQHASPGDRVSITAVPALAVPAQLALPGKVQPPAPAAVSSTSGRTAPSAAAIAAPAPVRSLAWAGVLACLVVAPAFGFGAFMRRQRQRNDAALVEQLRAQPAEVVKRLVHSINDSKCVGCGMCVQACPATVLDLVNHKSRVVNFDSCIQCKKCEHVCAFDALRMHDADKPPPMIPMPSIDAFHETPVAGMFLIGQAAGVPQVKNATNLGRAVVQRILQQGYVPQSAAAHGLHYDVVIVGSGPAGLAAALTCAEFGLTYCVLEKEREFAWTIRNYYHKGKEVMAEPHDIALVSSLPHWDTSREDLLAAWATLIAQARVPIIYGAHVTDVRRDIRTPDNTTIGFTVHATGGAQGSTSRTAARVILAVGTLGNPRTLGCPGDALPKVKNSLVDPSEWRDRRVLVVGGSDSAVEVALALATHNRVWFSTRGAKLEGIKPKNRSLIEAAIAAGRCTMLYATQVAEVTETNVTVVYKEDGRREELPNDVVFAMIGGTPPTKWLQQLGIPFVDKPHAWSPPRTDLLAQKTAEGLIPVTRLRRK